MARRNTRLIGNSLYHGQLTAISTESDRACLAEIPRTIAGNNRCMYEHLKGTTLKDPTTAEPIGPCAPPNARGRLGHDHSGKPYGKALTTSYWSMACQNIMATTMGATSTYLEEPPGINYPASSATYQVTWPIWVPVPACGPDGDYHTATVYGWVYVANNDATAAVKLLVWPEGMGDTEYRNDSIDVTTNVAYQTCSIANVDVVPGRINEMTVGFQINGTGGTVEVQLQGLCFSQA